MIIVLKILYILKYSAIFLDETHSSKTLKHKKYLWKATEYNEKTLVLDLTADNDSLFTCGSLYTDFSD